MAERATGPRAAEEFYVGYRAMPPGLRRWVRRLAPTLLAGVALSALTIARLQSDPGAGVWETGAEIVVEGVLRAAPYPMIEGAAGGETWLLVETLKRGAQERAASLDGQRVRARGWRVERDGRKILELAPRADALVGEGAAGAPAGAARAMGAVTLRGEIMDAKCYLGAMKPGEGKTHKACATLCIRGGIPPALVVRGAGGAAEYFLLTDERGGPAPREILPLVGEPVVVRGEASEGGGWKRLAVGAGGVRRE